MVLQKKTKEETNPNFYHSHKKSKTTQNKTW